MIKSFVEIIRPKQWYKNLLLFLPLIFSSNLFDFELTIRSIAGFILLCMAFGGTYIINDIVDSKKDLLHPKKAKRPLPSKRITKNQAILFAGLLFLISGIFSFYLSLNFFLIVLLIVVLTIAYSFKIKNIFLVDVFFISINYVLRALAGAFLIDVSVSPWLIIGVFFVALLLAFGKRKNESVFLKNKEHEHRKVLSNYTPKVLKYALAVSSTALIISYSIYAISGPPQINDWRLVITIPIAFFILILYVSITLKGNYKGAEFNDLLISDKKLIMSIFVFILLVIFLLYTIPSGYFR